MKNRVFLLVFGSADATLAAFAQTSTPTKVGIINIQQAIVAPRKVRKPRKSWKTNPPLRRRSSRDFRRRSTSLRDQLNKLSSVGSEEQKRKLMGDIDGKTKSFNRQVEDAQAELDQEQGRVLNELGGRMLAVLDKYAKDNGYAVILDVSSQQTPVLFAANGIDVTREVVDLYNKNAPAAPASTGAAPHEYRARNQRGPPGCKALYSGVEAPGYCHKAGRP